MALITYPIIAPARTFPLPAASRIYPSVGGLVSIPVRLYTTTTRSALRTNIQENLFNNFWTDDEINSFINEALRIWNTLTGYFRSKVYVSIPPGDPSYTLYNHADPNAFAILRMNLNDTAQMQLGLEEISQFNPNYQDDEDDDPTSWIALGLNKFILYPITTETVNGYLDLLLYATIPTSDDDYIQVGEEDMNAIVNFCRFLAALKEGGEELKTALPLFKEFLAQAAKYNAKLTTSAIFRKALGMAAGGQTDLAPTTSASLNPR